MKIISNPPDLEWQLTRGIVAPHLIETREFDIEVKKWLDGKKSKSFNKMLLHPIETGNYIELREKNRKDPRGFMLKYRDLIDMRIAEETVGSIRKRNDLLMELTFVDSFSDDAVKHSQKITINVDDKEAYEILDMLKRFKDIEEIGAYWTSSSIVYTNTDDQEISTEIFLEAPFFARDEKILWMFIITEKDGKIVNYIRILTNFRILEYNYQLHVGRAMSLKDIEDVSVSYASTNKKNNSDVFGIFLYSDKAVEGIERGTKEVKTVGDITFITKGGPFVTFENAGNPDHIAQILRFQKEKIVSFRTDAKAVKKNWDVLVEGDPFHIPSLLGKDSCAICKKELGFWRYNPKKEWNIEGKLCGDCFSNPTKLGVKAINSKEDFNLSCFSCAKNVAYFEFESENLCFRCFEQKYGMVLLTASNAQYYGGHKVHLAGGVFSEYESGKLYLTDEYFIFAKGNKEVSKRWEIIIPLNAIVVEQWNVKGEPRRTQIIGGAGALSGNVAIGGGVMHETGQRHRLLIPYVDENGIVQQPIFGVSSYRGKDIRKLAEKIYELLATSRRRLSQNVDGSDQSIDILKRRFAKGEINKEEYEEMRKVLET